MIPTVENRSIRRKAVTLPIFTPQISHVLAQDQTRAFRFEAAAIITRAIVRPLAFVVCPTEPSWLAYKQESTRRHISSSLATSTLYTRSCPCRASEICSVAAETSRRRHARKWRNCGKSTHTHTRVCIYVCACIYVYIYIYKRE